MMLRCSAARAVLVAAAASLVAVAAAAQEPARTDLLEGIGADTPGPDLFLRAYKVFSHPRCSNCHPRDDRPRWGTRVHGMNVQRGADQPPGDKSKKAGGYGLPGMRCAACHQQTGGELSGSPPGAQSWRLAPKEMGWVGLTPAQLCEQFKKVEPQDGCQGIEVVTGHIVKPACKAKDAHWEIDPLVVWAWTPRPSREPPPGNVEQLVKILTWWKDGGAVCPSK
jgi:hypothetical protein